MRTVVGRGVDRSLVAILGVVVALVVATVVVALTVADERRAEYPVGSPERRLQEYVAAIGEGDVDAAYDLMAAEYRRDVSRVEFADRYRYLADRLDDTRIAIEESEVEGDRATITLAITTVYADDLSYDEYEREERVTLVREEGEWRLVQPVLY